MFHEHNRYHWWWWWQCGDCLIDNNNKTQNWQTHTGRILQFSKNSILLWFPPSIISCSIRLYHLQLSFYFWKGKKKENTNTTMKLLREYSFAWTELQIFHTCTTSPHRDNKLFHSHNISLNETISINSLCDRN